MNNASSWMKEYAQRWAEEMKNQPEKAMFREGDYTYIVVKDTEENRKKFENKFGTKIPEHVFVYFNKPYDYDNIVDGMLTRAKLKAEREKLEKINNPKVNKEIEAISSKDELINFLIEYYDNTEEVINDEFSGEDFEVDEAQRKANVKALKSKSAQYINGGL